MTVGQDLDQILESYGVRITDLEDADTAQRGLNDQFLNTDTQIQASVTELEGSLTGLSDRENADVAVLSADIRDLQTNLTALDARESSDVSSLATDLSRNISDVLDLEERQDALGDRVSAVEMSLGRYVGWPGYVSLRAFTGSDDTARMRDAMAKLAQQPSGTREALILPPGTTLAPGTVPFQLFDGAGIVGGVVPETEFSHRSRVTISGAAPNGVFKLSSASFTRNVVIANIGWEGPGLSQICRFMPDEFSKQLQYSLFHGVSFDNFTSVMRQRLLGFVWSGLGYCNNSSETPLEFTGSDYYLFTDKFYLDSPNLKDTDYLLHIRSGNKCVIGSVFVTGDGPTPVRISGGQLVRLLNLEMEAEGIPRKTAGAGLFISGGNVIVDNAWFFRTMFNPSATGRGDNGVIHVEGNGTCVRVNNPTFGEYNTAPEKPYTENHIYAGGSSKVYVQSPLPWNMQGNSGVGSLSGGRALQVGKAGTGQILQANYTSL